MQEDVESRHGAVNLVDEPRSERREPADHLRTCRLPAQKDESKSIARRIRQALADLGGCRDPFWGGPRTDETPDPGGARPAAFEPPVSWFCDRWLRYPGVDEVDAGRVD